MTNSTYPRFCARVSIIVAAALTWRRRAAGRAQLSQLDPRTLRDIGCTEIDRSRECDKWFWQA